MTIFRRKLSRLLAQQQTLSSDDLSRQVMALSKGMMFRDVRLPVGIPLFRVRPERHVDTVSELSYPPVRFARANRANREGRPMFYASTWRSGATQETNIQPGQTFLVSCWLTVAPVLCSHLGFHPETYAALGADDDAVQRIRASDLHAGGATKDQLLAFAELFVSEDRGGIYRLSTAVAECMLNGPFDALAYPSVPGRGGADNVALKPEAADRCLRFVGVEKSTLSQDGKTDHVFDYATRRDDGSLDWKGRPPDMRHAGQSLRWRQNPANPHEMVALRGDEVLTARGINGTWHVFDSSGAYVDPE